MKNLNPLGIGLLLALSLLAGVNQAAAQNTMFTYQGRMLDNGTNYTGAGLFQFALIGTNGTVTTTYWSNDGTSVNGFEPSAAVTVGVTNGLFTVAVGNTALAHMATLPSALFTQTNLQLKIWFNDGFNGFQALPAQTLTPAPYAIFATMAGTLSGPVASASLSGNYAGALTLSNASDNFYGNFTGDGGGLTNLSFAQLTFPADVTFSNVFVTGSLNLPSPALVNSAGAPLLYSDDESDTVLGIYAFSSNTRGYYNTAIGTGALESSTTGKNNTANGAFALLDDISGNENVAVGTWALANSTNDFGSVAIGYEALQNDNAQGQGSISGNAENTAIGCEVLTANTVGIGNTGIGYQSLVNNTNGTYNTAVGDMALITNTTGSLNTALGAVALYYNTTGSGNTAVGAAALSENMTGSDNTAVGVAALPSDMSGSDNTAVGASALGSMTNGGENTAIGTDALDRNTSGSGNTAVGYFSLYDNTTGSDNTVYGDLALSFDVNDSQNVALGELAMGSTTNESDAVAIGFEALSDDNAAGQATFSGYGENTAVGYQALLQTTIGVGNTGLGFNSLLENHEGYYNTAVGDLALYANLNGDDNTADGQSALLSSANGMENTAEGAYALDSLATGNNNTALGAGAGTNLVQGNFNIYIGNPGNPQESGTIRIGNPGFQSATYLTGNVYSGGTFTDTSDRNVKTGFQAVDVQAILAKVVGLPITRWQYTNDVATPHVGPMAQDFHAAFNIGPDDRHITTIDEGGVALAAIQGLNQKLQGEMKAKDAEIAQLQAKAVKVDDLEKQLSELAAAVKVLAGK